MDDLLRPSIRTLDVAEMLVGPRVDLRRGRVFSRAIFLGLQLRKRLLRVLQDVGDLTLFQKVFEV